MVDTATPALTSPSAAPADTEEPIDEAAVDSEAVEPTPAPDAPLEESPPRKPLVKRIAREHIGLAALVVLFIGIGGLFVLGRPFYVGTDETSHVGYAQSIAHFELPTINGFPPVPDEAMTWRIERATARDDRYLGVWVANHPPLFYMSIAPAMWISNAIGAADGGLVVVRFGNLIWAVFGVVFSYLIGVRLSGGVRRIGLTAAGFTALLGLSPAVFSLGFNDGAGFAAGSMALWAVVRCLQAPNLRPSRKDLYWLAGAATLCAGTRAAATLMTTVLVGVLGLMTLLAKRSAPEHRWRAVAKLVLAGMVVPAVLFGWFYLRNRSLYGDIGASAYLLDQFVRETRGSVAAMFTEGRIWGHLFRRLTTPSTIRSVVIPGLLPVLGAVIAGWVIAMRKGRTADIVAPDQPGRIDRTAMGVLLIGFFVITVTVAQHLSGGGMAHSRYLFPALAVMGVIAALAADQVWPRVAPAAMLVWMAWWVILRIPTDADRLWERRRRYVYVYGSQVLQRVPGSTAVRAIFIVAIVLGALVGAWVLVASIIRPKSRLRSAS